MFIAFNQYLMHDYFDRFDWPLFIPTQKKKIKEKWQTSILCLASIILQEWQEWFISNLVWGLPFLIISNKGKKINYFAFLLMYSQCGVIAPWATRHTTMCFDFDTFKNNFVAPYCQSRLPRISLASLMEFALASDPLTICGVIFDHSIQ